MNDYEEALRHHYRIVTGGEFVPGVTTVIGETHVIRALPWSAAKIAARTALAGIGEFQEIVNLHRANLRKSRDADKRALAEGFEDDIYVDWCKRSFDQEWKAKAARGTRVHDVAERWTKGETVDVSMEDSGFVDALEKFYVDHLPHFVLAEEVVINRWREYGGRFDGIVRLSGGTYMLDWKTGNHYPYEVALQAAAYMACDLATFDDEGNLGECEPLPELDGARIVYLHEDGTYQIVNPFLHVSQEDATNAFNHAVELYTISKKINESIKNGEKNAEQ
jgi:hypothetical protein